MGLFEFADTEIGPGAFRGKTLRNAAVGALVALATACQGGLKQDPLAGQPEHIRQGVPPELDKKPEPARPVQQESLRIDTQEFYDFRESEEGSVVLQGRALTPGVEYELIVENLQDFPGATLEPVDPKNPMAGLTFKWTPAADFSALEFTRRLRLSVVLATTNTPVRLAVRKQITVLVTRRSNVPEIVSVEDLSVDPIREGEQRRFKIVVRDLDGFDAPEGRPAVVFVANRLNRADISPLIALDSIQPVSQDPNDKSQWIYQAWVDARGREITRDEGKFSFAIQAISRFGAPSAHKHVNVLVRTSVREPVLSWKTPVAVFAGEEVIFNFQVFDPNFEGRVSVNFLDRPEQALGQAAWDCPPVENPAEPLICTIRWKVPQNPARTTFDVPMELRNKSQVPGDRADSVVRASGRFHVRQPPAPSAPEHIPPSPVAAPAAGGRN